MDDTVDTIGAFPAHQRPLVQVTEVEPGHFEARVGVLGLVGRGATADEATRLLNDVVALTPSAHAEAARVLYASGRPEISEETSAARRVDLASHLAVTPTSVDDLISSGRRVLIDFWGPNCRTCLVMAPAVLSVAEELSHDVEFAQADVEAYPELAERFGVLTRPTLILFVDGSERARLLGVRGKNVLRAELQEALGVPQATLGVPQATAAE